MKETGINWFYDALDLDTGAFAVFYTFEDGAGTTVSSVPSGQAVYAGELSSATNFWVKPGSGFFSGNSLAITNASGLSAGSWTDIFVYEKVNTDACVLFDSMGAGSGYRIGITKSNKPYFESDNGEPIIGASLNNYSSKNVVSFSYFPNYLTIGYLNFNTQLVEQETFDLPFQINPSDDRKIGSSYTGYMDYYIHVTQPMAPQVQSQWLSGLYVYPTGSTLPVTSVCTTGITGYQDVLVYETGVTGYSITPGGDEGRDYYTGQFPTTFSQGVLTGILSSGLYSSGVSGDACYPVTGDLTTAFVYLTGYASSFGMQKTQAFYHTESTDVVKQSVSYTLFEPFYNIVLQHQYSGYLIDTTYGTGQLNPFLNGVAQNGDGWTLNSGYLLVSGGVISDSFFFDSKSGSHQTFTVAGGTTGFAFAYSGQEIFLNGVNLISGYDYLLTAGTVNLTHANTGITGYIFEYPVVLTSVTGVFTVRTGAPFQRNTTNLYLNGVRQQNYSTYTEGAVFDLLSGNSFNPAECVSVYDNSNLYWEIT
jgi:hypothetical protein